MAQSATLLSRIANKPYMNSGQLRFFEERLLSWRKRLNAILASSDQVDAVAPETSPDWIDIASTQTQAEMAQVNRTRAVSMIREIDAALGRIRDGSYGFCVETGDEIGLKRLLAMPTAQFSVIVQEEHEQRRRINR